MNNTSKKKQKQLGMPIGTASARLKKALLFNLLSRLGENVCFQCKERIKTAEELSVEHKVPWLDSEDPIDLFFNLDNVAFSHLKCNCKTARQTKKKKHPSWQAYKDGCRCKDCKKCNAVEVALIRKRR